MTFLVSRFDLGDGSMQRSMLGRATLVVVVVVATIALTGESSVGETIQCRTSPGAPAPQGMHWYYRVDRTNNRHCWFTQSAGLPVHSQRNEMPSNPTPHIARERISAPLQTDPTELSQLEIADADSTDTLTPSVGEPKANFTTRWSDLPKSVDLGQHESTTRDNYAPEPAASDSTKPVASTGLVAADSKRESPHKSASAVYFWSIFLAAALGMILFAGRLKLTRWLYRSVTSWWTPNDCAETNPSELVRALRLVDGAFNAPQSFSPSVAVTDVRADQDGLTRDSVGRRPHSAPRRFATILAEVGEQASCGRPHQPFFSLPLALGIQSGEKLHVAGRQSRNRNTVLVDQTIVGQSSQPWAGREDAD
jgi:hypothetical protein